MLKGGVIMDVTTPEEARIAEEAGAVAVMALERVPADIRKDGGVARMSDASVIKAIKAAVTIPVMAKARIGHFVEAQILEALDVDYIDESEVSGLGLSVWEQLQWFWLCVCVRGSVEVNSACILKVTQCVCLML
jgi:pyridoxal 5'-phosphate synthase subunit Pdx1